jgi:hypothetical protein
MAIINPKAPEAGRHIVSENVGQIHGTRTHGIGPLLQDIRSEELSAVDPHQSYYVALKDIVSGHLLDAARATAWRYLIIKGNSAVAEAELNADEKAGKLLNFIGLYQSPFAQATLAALRIAENLPQVKKQDYELRYLKIPSLYLAAIWLHGQADDILIALEPAPAGLKANQPYSQSEVIKLLKSTAQKAEKFDSNFERAQGKPSKR